MNEILQKSTTAEQSEATDVAISVYDELRRDIIGGKLLPGAKLRVAELMRRYGSGLNPTREALKRLTGEVLVAHSEQRGFSVMPVSESDLRDLTQARALIVGTAIRRSIQLGDNEWEERVLLAWHRLGKSERYSNLKPITPNPQYDTLHLEFHLALTSGLNSAWLQDAEKRLFQQSERYRHLALRLVIKPREAEHEEIVTAALARNAEEAGQLAERHIHLTCEIILDALRRL